MDTGRRADPLHLLSSHWDPASPWPGSGRLGAWPGVLTGRPPGELPAPGLSRVTMSKFLPSPAFRCFQHQHSSWVICAVQSEAERVCRTVSSAGRASPCCRPLSGAGDPAQPWLKRGRSAGSCLCLRVLTLPVPFAPDSVRREACPGPGAGGDGPQSRGRGSGASQLLLGQGPGEALRWGRPGLRHSGELGPGGRGCPKGTAVAGSECSPPQAPRPGVQWNGAGCSGGSSAWPSCRAHRPLSSASGTAMATTSPRCLGPSSHRSHPCGCS